MRNKIIFIYVIFKVITNATKQKHVAHTDYCDFWLIIQERITKKSRKQSVNLITRTTRHCNQRVNTRQLTVQCCTVCQLAGTTNPSITSDTAGSYVKSTTYRATTMNNNTCDMRRMLTTMY